MVSDGKVVGKTASAGYQIGVRRTLPISKEQAWSFLTSSEGVRIWLGEVAEVAFAQGARFASSEGITGEFRVVKPLEQLRLRWGKKEWAKPSTVQIRLLGNDPDRTTISFHQENLDHASTREQMKQHWEDVLNTIQQQTIVADRGEESR